MSSYLVHVSPNMSTPHHPVVFDIKICTGCNECVETCQMDVFIPHPENGKPPILLFPDECIYCSACVSQCPQPGAIKLNRPLVQRIRWKNKM